jgi:hypothetical protein
MMEEAYKLAQYKSFEWRHGDDWSSFTDSLSYLASHALFSQHPSLL